MSLTPADALPPELSALPGRFDITETEVELTTGTVRLSHPRDYDDLISEADFVRDDRLPYWADLWPSAIALARVLPSMAKPGARTLEIGCGLGLVTIAALQAGLEVLASDYYEDALLFTRRNALVAAGREPRTRIIDWRAWPNDVGRFDLILASDLLYEQSYASLIAAAIARALAPGGRALIADPGRAAFGMFVAECETFDLLVRDRRKVPHEDGAIHQVITIYEVALDHL